MNKIDNPHACGACGFDGGVEHQKELGELKNSSCITVFSTSVLTWNPFMASHWFSMLVFVGSAM